MFKEIQEDAKATMNKALDTLQRELSKTRTGRANPAVLDGVRVEYYGAPTPLNQVAAVAVADPRLITIKPWDKGLLQAIERAIIKADLGVTPSSDGELVRIPIPPLSKERREEICKAVRKHGEETRVAIRNARRDANELVNSLEGTSEDDQKRALKQIQDLTDQFTKKVDETVAKKESEIMEI
jgi:ribosome recycling factor